MGISEDKSNCLTKSRQQRHSRIEIDTAAHIALVLEKQSGTALSIGMNYSHEPSSLRQLSQKRIGNGLHRPVNEYDIEGCRRPKPTGQSSADDTCVGCSKRANGFIRDAHHVGVLLKTRDLFGELRDDDR